MEPTAPKPTEQPPSPQPVKTPRVSKFYLKLILGILVLVLLGGLIFWRYLQSATPKPSPTQPTQSSKQPAPSSGQNQLDVVSPALNLTLDVQSSDSGKVKGVLRITNTTDKAYSGLYYNITLKEPDIVQHLTTSTGFPVTLSIGGVVPIQSVEADIPSLQSRQTEDVNFELPYSSHLPPASYGISADVYDKPSVSLGHTIGKNVGINGSNDYLLLQNCVVMAGGSEYDPVQAPISTADKPATGQCDVLNPNNKAISVKYKTDYAVRHVELYPESQKLHQTSDTLLTFAANEKRAVTFPLPDVAAPQVYEAEITLVDDQGQDQSFPMLFRWTVSGPSAFIQNVSLDKDFYFKGDGANLTVDAYPSLDLYWRTASGSGSPNLGTVLQNPKISLSVVDQGQKLCGQLNQNLPKVEDINSWGTLQFSVPIQNDCSNPRVEAAISDGNLQLATLSKQFLTSSSSKPEEAKARAIPPIVYPIAGLILLVIVFIIFKFKPRKPLPLTILIIAASACLLLTGPKVIRAQALIGPGGVIRNYQSDHNAGYFTINYQDANDISFHTYQDGNSVSCGNDYAYMDMIVSTNYGWVSIPHPSYGSSFPPVGYTRDYWGGPRGTIAQVSPGNWVQKDHEDYTFSFGGVLTNIDGIFVLQVATYHGSHACGNSNLGFCGFSALSNSSSNAAGPQEGNYHWVKPCSSPDPSTVCSGHTYTDSGGNSCTGTKACDTTPPTVSISGFPPPGKTCLTAADLATNFASAVSVDPGTNPSGVAWVHFFVNDLTVNTVSSALGSALSGGLYKTDIRSASPSLISGHLYTVSAQAADNAGNVSAVSAPSSKFDYDANQCVNPFLQTTGGDVHSNGGINTPGGP